MGIWDRDALPETDRQKFGRAVALDVLTTFGVLEEATAKLTGNDFLGRCEQVADAVDRKRQKS